MLCIAIYIIIISLCLRYASSTGSTLLAKGFFGSFVLQGKNESTAVLNQAFLQLCYSFMFNSVFE